MIDQRLANDQDLGYTKEKPIPVNGPLGELTYLSRLVVKEPGSRVFFHRLGSLKVMPDKNVDVYELLSWDGKHWDILYFNCYYRTKINVAPLKYTFAQQVEGLTGVNITLPLFPNGIYEATQQNAERIIGLPAANPKMRGIDTQNFTRPKEFLAIVQTVKRQLGDGIAFEKAMVAKKEQSASVDTLKQEKNMYDIHVEDPKLDFGVCWYDAGEHIEKFVSGKFSWLKSVLQPPFLEHFSFRYGNQLYFIRLEDVDGALQVPGTLQGLLKIAGKCNGYPCLMPMKCNEEGHWIPTIEGWGLLDARSNEILSPPDLATTEKIEMTDWEVYDFAVQIVRERLEKKQIMSWNSDLDVDPSIWFVGETGPEWVVVRAARYPVKRASLPKNIVAIAQHCSRLGKKGYFASVSFANQMDISAPLYRGYGCFANYAGLEEVKIRKEF